MKKCNILFGIVTFIFFCGFLAPKSSAISNNVVIYQVKTAGLVGGTSSQEVILLLNYSLEDINISDWCLQYSAGTNGVTYNSLDCFKPPDSLTELWLSPGGVMSIASSEFVTANPGFIPDSTMSAGLAAASGHIRLVDSNENEIDRVGWGTALHPESAAATAHLLGEVLSRDTGALVIDSDNNFNDFSSKNLLNPIVSGVFEKEVIVDICSNLDLVQVELPEGYMVGSDGLCYLDSCSNIEGLQIDVPEGYEDVLDIGICSEIPKENASLLITELFPNPVSYDTGLEFIEIYNPNNRSIQLKGYTLELGPAFTKKYQFTEGIIEANEYMVFSDEETGITLPNSSSLVRLVSPAGGVVSTTSVYENPSDTVSWALVEDIWIFTNQITPGSANKPYLQTVEDEEIGVTSVLGPCPAGKYRNPLTNRCRSIQTLSSVLTPCRADQYRNPQTNRCRNITTASSSLKPCAVRQERNPQTNRCRKIQTLASTASKKVLGVKDTYVQSSEEKMNWGVVGVSVFITSGYLIYEWRRELRLHFLRLTKKL